MAHVSADRVRDTSTSTGTGSVTVSGSPPSGFRTLSAVLSSADTFYYAIQHQTLSEWEVGLGTWSGSDTFARTTIYSSSNLGAAVTFSAGTKDVFITLSADRTLQLTATGGLSDPLVGTASEAALSFQAGTRLTTATAGAVEYDGKTFSATPSGAQRGIIPSSQYFRLNSALAGANSTAVQNVFGVGVTLASSTVYQFEFIFALAKTAGTTSHTVSIGFGGTATLNNIGFTAVDQYNSANFATGTPALMYSTTASQTVWTSAITLAAMTVIMSCRGTVSIATGGTFIPQYGLSAAPGGAYSTAIGSHMLIYPVGAAGANVNVGTWA